MVRRNQNVTAIIITAAVLFLMISNTAGNSFTITRNSNVGFFVISSGKSISPLAIGISPVNPTVGDNVVFNLVIEIPDQQNLCNNGITTTSAELLVRRNGVQITTIPITALQNQNLCQNFADVQVDFTPNQAGDYDVSLQIFGSDNSIVTQDFETFTVTDSNPVDCSDVTVPECGEAQWETLETVNCVANQRRICQEVVEENGQCVLKSKAPEFRSVSVPNCSEETCNGLDDDADGLVDENPSDFCGAEQLCRGTEGCIDKSQICQEEGGTKDCQGLRLDMSLILLFGGIGLVGLGIFQKLRRK